MKVYVPFYNVDEAKAALGIAYGQSLRPTAVECNQCGQLSRARAGSHTCLWCELGNLLGYPVFPR